MTNEVSHIDEQTTEAASASEMSVPESPFCHQLRSKKFFMFDALATEADQYMDGSNHCWCYGTQQVIGPDGGRVKPERCVPGRLCYQSAFA